MYPSPRSLSRRFHFDTFEADTETGELRWNGTRLPLQEVPFRFLVALLERPGGVVSREELRDRIWPRDVNLDFEGALDTAARKVRQALGDAARAPSYIETLPGRGYRFLREVTIDAEEAGVQGDVAGEASPDRVVWLRNGKAFVSEDPIPAVRKWLVLGAVLGILLLVGGGGLYFWKPWLRGPKVPGHVPSVLALPAKVLGAPEMAYLADALPMSLSTILAGVEGLETKLPPIRLEMEKAKGDLWKIAELYHVDNLVLTSVTVQDKRLLLDLQLVDASTRKVRWARHLEGTQDEYLAMVRSGADAVLEVIKPGGVLHRTAASASSEMELTLAEARHFCRQYWHLGRLQDFEFALGALQRAERLEPKASEPPAWMAQLWNDRFWNTRDPAALRSARTCVERALALDSRCGRAWMVRGWFPTNQPVNDPEEALSCAVKAVCYSPQDPRVHQALGTILAGSNAILTATGRRSMELDPLDVSGHSWAALGLIWNGRAEEGLPILERSLRLEPNVGFNRFLVFFAHFKLGRMEEARRSRISGAGGDWVPGPDTGEDIMCAMAGQDLPRARRLAAESLRRWRVEASPGSMDWVNRALFVAPLMVSLGLKDDALWLLRKSVEARNPPPYDWLLLDPDMRALKGDPRFQVVMVGSRGFAELCVKHLEQARSRRELPSYLEAPLVELRELLSRPIP